jgi:transcriptional regulator with XRE-family HTH domain
MTAKSPTVSARRNFIGQALRLIRRARQLRTRDAGAAMGIGQRSYEYVEAGKSGTNFDRLRLFAAATNSDANAIMAAYVIGSPAFALRAADNKLVTAIVIELQEFDQDLGDDIALLDAACCINAFNEAFAQLIAEAKRRKSAREALGRFTDDPDGSKGDGD